MSLHGCVSKNQEEIDGEEFTIDTLPQLVSILKASGEVHLNYFDDDEDLDMWVGVQK